MIAFVDLSVPLTFAIHPDRSLIVVTRLRRATFDEWSQRDDGPSVGSFLRGRACMSWKTAGR